ncbi:MAG: NusG domain II-containing protein [Clostridiaceae bacterium]|nr:NusG domain II-containing protein [Clostridiaceae bacterium]
MKIKLKPGDFVIVALIISVALICTALFTQKHANASRVVISKDGEILYDINLKEVHDRTDIRNLSEYNELIVIEDGKVRFESSDCPDQVCVRTGWISKPGQTAVCLPAGIIVKIVGENTENNSDDIDIILR